jgi:hypothetical protein
MKVKLIILMFITLISCKPQEIRIEPNKALKYNVGDVIYIKPDSVKGYIFKKGSFNEYYKVSYFDKLGKEQILFLDDLQIY